MPKVTIWIRVKDLDKWQAIPDKPEFIHNALKREPVFVMQQDKFMEFRPEPVDTFEDHLPQGVNEKNWSGPIPKSVSARKKEMTRPAFLPYSCPACRHRYRTRALLNKHLISQGSEYFVK